MITSYDLSGAVVCSQNKDSESTERTLQTIRCHGTAKRSFHIFANNHDAERFWVIMLDNAIVSMSGKNILRNVDEFLYMVSVEREIMAGELIVD